VLIGLLMRRLGRVGVLVIMRQPSLILCLKMQVPQIKLCI
jgi:hypothetical protein